MIKIFFRSKVFPSFPYLIICFDFLAHSLFSAGQLPASYNPMAAMPGYGLLGQGGPSPFAPPPSSGSGSSSNNASLNQASKSLDFSPPIFLHQLKTVLLHVHRCSSTSSLVVNRFTDGHTGLHGPTTAARGSQQFLPGTWRIIFFQQLVQ